MRDYFANSAHMCSRLLETDLSARSTLVEVSFSNQFFQNRVVDCSLDEQEDVRHSVQSYAAPMALLVPLVVRLRGPLVERLLCCFDARRAQPPGRLKHFAQLVAFE